MTNQPAQSQSEPTEYIPSHALRTFTQVLLTPELKGNKTLVERITGIRRDRFNYNIKHNAQFRLWFEAQCDRALMDLRPKVDAYLMEQVEGGIVPAMRTYYEVVGKIKNKVVNNSLSVDNRDMKLEVNVYPQKTFVFQDVIPTDGDKQLTNGTDGSPDADGVHAVESAKSDLVRLPL